MPHKWKIKRAVLFLQLVSSVLFIFFFITGCAVSSFVTLIQKCLCARIRWQTMGILTSVIYIIVQYHASPLSTAFFYCASFQIMWKRKTIWLATEYRLKFGCKVKPICGAFADVLWNTFMVHIINFCLYVQLLKYSSNETLNWIIYLL